MLFVHYSEHCELERTARSQWCVLNSTKVSMSLFSQQESPSLVLPALRQALFVLHPPKQRQTKTVCWFMTWYLACKPLNNTVSISSCGITVRLSALVRFTASMLPGCWSLWSIWFLTQILCGSFPVLQEDIFLNITYWEKYNFNGRQAGGWPLWYRQKKTSIRD